MFELQPSGDHSFFALPAILFHLLSVDYFTTMALFPQEILERVLAHAVVAPASPFPRAPWHSSAVILGALFK
jgi:hypothetical protein